MQHHWDLLDTIDYNEFTIRVHKTWEESHPSDFFDDVVDPVTGESEVSNLCQKIDDGDLEWFVLRVQIFYTDMELGTAYLGGLLYSDSRDTLTDGTVNDLIVEASHEALAKIRELSGPFMMMALKYSDKEYFEHI